MVRKLIDIRKFLGTRVFTMLVMSIGLGVAWFAIEAGFLIVFRGFLVAVGVMTVEQVKSPVWYPTDLSTNLCIFMLYGLLRSLISGLNRYLPMKAGQIFETETRSKLLHISFLNKHRLSSSEVVTLFGETINKSGVFILNSAAFAGLVISVILMISFSTKVAPIETLIGLLLLGTLILPLRSQGNRVKNYGSNLQREWGGINKVLIEGLRNIFLLRIYNMLGSEYKRGITKINSYAENYSNFLINSSISATLPLFLGLMIIALVTFISRTFLDTSPISFIAFLYIFLRISQGASQCASSASGIQLYLEPFIKIKDFIESEMQNSDTSTKIEIKHSIKCEPVELSIKNLTFSYPGSVIFNNFNLNLASKNFLLIKGHSGVGKSTLIKLIAGLEIPQLGSVLINNMPANQFIKNWAHTIGYVGPEPFLIPGTVRENLTYGNNNNLSDDLIWDILKTVDLSDLIKTMPLGLEELLYEDSQISTGQKQRMSLARALLRSPSMLILDEATANIDPKTEALIVLALNNLKSSTTIVAVSHRESFDKLADQTLLLS